MFRRERSQLLIASYMTNTFDRVLEAGERGKIITYIVCLGVTYGSNTGPVKNLGVAYNILTGNAIQHGFVPYVGNGTAAVCTVHSV